MSKLLNLKCINLNDKVVKCGFPIAAIDKYLKILKDNNIKINIVDKIDHDYEVISNVKLNGFLKKIEKLDINRLSGLKALELIEELRVIINGN